MSCKHVYLRKTTRERDKEGSLGKKMAADWMIEDLMRKLRNES